MAQTTIKDYSAGAVLSLMTALTAIGIGHHPDYAWTWWEIGFDLYAAVCLIIGALCLNRINRLLDQELGAENKRTECTQEKPTLRE